MSEITKTEKFLPLSILSKDSPRGDTRSPSLRFDLEAASAQLRALGYEDGDTIHFRAILKKGGATNFKGTLPDLPCAEIERHQQEGKNIYFVVNGGGHKDGDINQFRAIFYEHDDLSIDAQISLWKALELPKPTLQVYSGGKSVHSYWRLADSVTHEQWKVLQTDLLEYANADRTLKNPSRVMRLAGAWHIENGKQSTIIRSN